MSTLTIISHTEHYKTPDGTIVGLGSTVTEINHLLEVFDEISHVAMLHNAPAPPSALPYISDKITFIPLPAVGGPKLADKLAVVFKAPEILAIIKKAISKTDYFQFRAPTGIGVFVIPYLVLFCSKKGWFKYAGNWKQKNAPVAYSFQRWLLKNQKRKVTINGKWKNQPSHCLTFENPCLTASELLEGRKGIENKSLEKTAISFCFVGRLEEEKGIGLLIEALSGLNPNEKSKLDTIHIVGDGVTIDDYKAQAKRSNLKFIFHGVLSRKQVHDIYKQSHAIILPSASEGFPKVITEAMNYGCLPVVSNVSSIGNYIKDGHNGFLLNTIAIESILKAIRNILELTEVVYKSLIQNQSNELYIFTYAYYNKRISNDLCVRVKE